MTTTSPAGLSEESASLRLASLQDAERTIHVVGRPVPLLKHVLRVPLTPAEAHVGRTFPTLEYRVDTAAIRHFQRLRSSWRKHRPDDSPKWVPPMFFADDGQQAVGTQFARSGRLHKSHRVEVFRRIPVGSLVRAQAHIAERQDKANGTTIVLECTISIVEDAGERVAVRTYATLLL